jgi:HTH-type transcriptional regulator/antitoxin MqsA
MQCPACGFEGTEQKTQDMKHTYRGRETVIPSVAGEYCPSCGEVILSGNEAHRVSKAMLEFNKQVNASIER